ncbi:serine/threonine protein kinase [Arthroderma uncinatum]|uniref:serine/threonine protein kinase n=1 Tax=Arthroderma uncinatum TaxID=74035 RepID=UPI00144AF9BF|nr:serine/threonine protein kinase [Arthroderma uncinatum]KAF3484462.1 serine/threonine protein kinase [Arthroderma uncinatum]
MAPGVDEILPEEFCDDLLGEVLNTLGDDGLQLDEPGEDLLAGALNTLGDDGLQIDEPCKDLLEGALNTLGNDELQLDEPCEDLLAGALNTLEDGVLASDLIDLDLNLGNEDDYDGDNILDEALDALRVNEESTSGDAGIPMLIDPLEEKVTSIRNMDHQYMSTLSHFTSILSRTGISGPRHLRQFNLKMRAAKIGSGAQFTVFRDNVGFTGTEGLVIKRVNVPLTRDDGVRFAAGDEYRLQLRTLELEVQALCNPSLRNHRNLAKLVAWGYDYPLPDTPVPVLFMECALMTLTDFFKEKNKTLSGDNPLDIKHQLALDVAAGIEALHSLRIVHGDIKPDNVLVFKESRSDKVPFCGKISDFGVCVDMEIPGSELTSEDYRGTPGWIDPEIPNFSKWTKGPFQPDIMFKYDSYSLGLVILSIFTKQAEPVDLDMDSESPIDIAMYLLKEEKSLSFQFRMHITRALRTLLAEDPWSRARPSPDLLKFDSSAYSSWFFVSEIRHSGPLYVGSIDQMHNQGANFWRRLDTSVVQELEEQYRTSKDSLTRDALFGLAQSITRRESYIDSLLEDAGGFAMDPALGKPSVVEMARDVQKAAAWLAEGNKVVDRKGNTLLHIAAALGALDVVQSLVENAKFPADIQNDNHETPLIKACQAGHVRVIDYLINKGAKASVATKKEKLTALHWLFTLPEDCIHRVAIRGITAEERQKEFKFHILFSRSKLAVAALLDLGADINSTYQDSDMGSSPLFLAARNGEAELVELLLSRGADVKAIDPKGRNIFHYMGFYSPAHHGSLDYSWHYWIRHGNWNEHLERTTKVARLLEDAGAEIDAESRVPLGMTPILMASEESDGGVVCALAAAGANVETGNGDSVLHRWARIQGSKLSYPHSFLAVFESVCQRTKDIDAPARLDENTALHTLILGKRPEDELEGASDIIFAHSPPPVIDARNRRGWTALFGALYTESNPERRALYMIEKGANIVIHADDEKDIFFPIAYNIVFSDQECHDLIVKLLSHLIQKEPDMTDIKQAYQKYFLIASGAIQTLAAAAEAGRVKTVKLLLDLGLERNINNFVNTRPLYTVLDSALHKIEARRESHLVSLASYTSIVARKRALADGNVHGKTAESAQRAAEAYSGAPGVLHMLRSRGGKRACELGALPPNTKLLELNQPDGWDITDLYFLGFTAETQPDKDRWAILYELSRQTENWRENLIHQFRQMYEFDIWRPDLRMLEAAVKAQDEKNARETPETKPGSEVVEFIDREFYRQILVMLTDIGQVEHENIAEKTNGDERAVWVEVRETTRYGSNGLYRTTPGYKLEVELLGIRALGKTRKTKVEEE